MRTMAPSALAIPPFNPLCLLGESISSEPVVTPYHEHVGEIWEVGCWLLHKPFPLPHSHAPYDCKTPQATLPPSTSCSFALKKIGKSTRGKRQVLFALNIKYNTMVNSANFNTELVPSLLFPWQFEWKANGVLPVNQNLSYLTECVWYHDKENTGEFEGSTEMYNARNTNFFFFLNKKVL